MRLPYRASPWIVYAGRLSRGVAYALVALSWVSSHAAVVVLQHGTDGYAGTTDAWFNETGSSRDHNNGGDPELHVKYDSNDNGYNEDHAIIKFALPSLSYASISSALLELYYFDAVSFSDDNAMGIKAYRVSTSKSWFENTGIDLNGQGVNFTYTDQYESVSWSFQSGGWDDRNDDGNGSNKIKREGGDPTDAIAPLNWVGFDVRPSVLQWYGGQANNGLLLFSSSFEGSGYTLYGRFYSRDFSSASLRPRLTLTFQGASISWSGAQNGTWDTSTKNWNVGGCVGTFGNGDTARFADGGSNPAISVAGGGVSPASVTIDNSSTTYAFSGGSINGGGSLTKSGAGTATLGVANGYGGATSISGGVLNIRHGSALGSTTAGTSVANGARLELENGIAVGTEPVSLVGTGGGLGALRNVSGANSWGGLVQLGADAEIRSDAGTLTLTGGISGAGHGVTFDGAGAVEVGTSGISGASSTLTKSGTGLLTLSTASTYGGPTTLSGGKVIVAANNALGTAGAGASVLEGAGLWLQGGVDYSTTEPLNVSGNGSDGSGAVFAPSGNNSFAGPVTLTGASAMGAGLFATLTLGGGIGGGYDFTKSGPGRLTLSGNNTLSGDVTVGAGTLALTGSSGLANCPTITVTGGATLEVTGRNGGELPLGSSQILTGGGLVDGQVAVLGRVAPGDSVGRLRTGAETWGGGGGYLCEINDLSRAPGIGSDLLAISGDLAIASTPANPFEIGLISLSGSLPGPAAGFSPDLPFSRAIATVAGTVQGFAADKFSVNTAQFVNDLKGGVFSVASGSVNLEFAPNHAPIAKDAEYYRRTNTSLKIKISSLLANRTSDPDGDACALSGYSPLSAQGVRIEKEGDYFRYVGKENGNDSFQYTVRDVRTYRPGDTVRTSTATVAILMVDDNAPSLNIVDIQVVDGKPHIMFAGIPHFWYEVQRTTTPAPPYTWVNLTPDGLEAPDPGVFVYVDRDPPEEQALYRTMER